MKTILYVLLVVVALPIFWIVGFLVADPLIAPDFEPVDLTDPPVDLAVLGAWEAGDGRLRCRAFYYRHLTAHSESLPSLRFRVSTEELQLCVTAFREFSIDGRWAEEFDWDQRGFLAAVQRPNDENPDLFVVTYRPDVDRVADSRYRIDPRSGQPTDFEFRGSFGPAQGLGLVLFGGAGGTVAWLLLVAYLVVRWVRARRATRSITSPETL